MDLEATAYHEAGHAIVTHWHGMKYRRVTIKPGDDYLGRVQGQRTQFDIEHHRLTNPGGARLRKWTETRTQILLAGGIAERRFTGQDNQPGSEDDLSNAFDIATLVNDGAPSETANKWLEWQYSVTETL